MALKRLLVVVALWASPALAQTPLCPTPPGPTCPLPSPLPLFPATNWWNLDISAAPVDGNSTNFINFIGAGDSVHPDFGGTDGTPTGIYGFPYIVVNSTQLKLEVDFVEFPDESDGVGQLFYPIPSQAITQAHWIEGGNPGNVPPNGDRHMLIVDIDNNLLYELYHVFHNGTNWEAGSGAFFDMKTNNRRTEGWTSADAAGLAILPGLVRYDEAYGSGPIKHAFRVTVHGTNGHVWPASHTAGSSSGAPPMGARLRLKPGVMVSDPDPGVQRIVQAMKTYGLIIADNGSDMYVSGTFDTRWDNDILNPALDQLQADDFQVIQLGYGSNFADLAVTKTDGVSTVFSGSPVTYTITVTNNGPVAVTGASVVDNFPAVLTSVSWTCVASAGASCGGGSGTGNISRLVNIPSGGTVTFTASGTVNPAAPSGTLSNTATATVPGGMLDPTPGNNSGNDTDTLLAGADLSMTKTDGQTTAAPGQMRTYTITAANAGPVVANGATVTDTVPAALTGAMWTCSGSGGGTCSPSGGPNITDTVNLPVGASVTYTLTGTVGANPSNLRNTATVAVPSGMGDPNAANNSATDEDTLLCFNETVVVPDGRLTTSTIAAGATAWFAASVNIGNWYSLEFKNTSGTSTPPGTLTLFRGDDGCRLMTSAAPADTSGIDPAGAGGITRVSFGASGTQTFFRARLVNSSPSSIPFSFGWSDTTMYSPAWSTNGSFDTFYSFQNTTGTSRVGTLTLLDATGGVVSVIFPVTIPAGQTASLNTASLGVPRNRTGTARFTHNGPPGAVAAEAAIANFSISPAYVQPVKFQAAREAR
jgi:uncharacterized repeat protein (TIGR01451 family)